MKKYTIVATVAAMFMMASCQSGVKSLDNQKFALTELNGTALKVNEMNEPRIVFEGNTVTACVGCNNIFAYYTAEKDGSLTFKQGASTKMFCPEEYREDEFVAAFNKVAKYTVGNDGVVNFLDADGNLLFKAK